MLHDRGAGKGRASSGAKQVSGLEGVRPGLSSRLQRGIKVIIYTFAQLAFNWICIKAWWTDDSASRGKTHWIPNKVTNEGLDSGLFFHWKWRVSLSRDIKMQANIFRCFLKTFHTQVSLSFTHMSRFSPMRGNPSWWLKRTFQDFTSDPVEFRLVYLDPFLLNLNSSWILTGEAMNISYALQLLTINTHHKHFFFYGFI